MVGQASSLSIKNDGHDARRHQILFLFAITFEDPYIIGETVMEEWRVFCLRFGVNLGVNRLNFPRALVRNQVISRSIHNITTPTPAMLV
jgi:hypothetical protein